MLQAKRGPDDTVQGRAWAACQKAVREYDESLVQGWKEDIDTLLVFVRPLLHPPCRIERALIVSLLGWTILCRIDSFQY